jgi:hypothetical protein
VVKSDPFLGKNYMKIPIIALPYIYVLVFFVV